MVMLITTDPVFYSADLTVVGWSVVLVTLPLLFMLLLLLLFTVLSLVGQGKPRNGQG